MTNSACRSCGDKLTESFCDLGMSPPSNAYLTADRLDKAEAFFPLHAYVCKKCLLVQLEQFQAPEEIFSDYAYFSSYSESWLAHCKAYTELMRARFGLNSRSQVIEIASNDGYLLQYFKAAGIPVLGIEPAANVANVAEEKGIPTLVRFFGRATAAALVEKSVKADLLLGNNVLAHVPALNDFVAGMKLLLKPAGVITMEFPHLLSLMAENQFDTIYHEHFSYFSYISVNAVFERHGLILFDVDEIPTHGGSLRIYAKHADDSSKPVSSRISTLLDAEKRAGLDRLDAYRSFAEQVKETKRALLEFLIRVKREGKSVVGYGAAAKGNTLLNYCGIRSDFLDYVVDRNPHKQGRFLPGSHIPIVAPERIGETRPDYVLILPWNIRKEIVEQMASIREWGGRFVVPVPRVEVLE
ncbi:class I SAM-dependent methyltransferase [Methylocaldum sp.]|uniref:class I SAM-dependent methyltransferase n=1 Tax=Methylocaldum sp. TaxID=1969727 RepID=UPI00321F6698